MNLDRLSQQEVSRLLGVSTRQVRRLEDEHGLPRREDGAYRWSDVRNFYLRFKVEEGLERRSANLGPSYEEARARREQIRARQAELNLAEREGKIVTREAQDAALGEALDLLRRDLLAVPGRWGAQVGFEDPRMGEKRLREIVHEVLDRLSGVVADELEVGGPPELPDDLPGRSRLEAAGVETVPQVRQMVADGELEEVRGIGPATADKIREALAAAAEGVA